MQSTILLDLSRTGHFDINTFTADVDKEKGVIFGVVSPSESIEFFAELYAKAAEPVQMLFGPKEPCIRWGQGWTNPFATRGVKSTMRPFLKIL